MSTSYGQQSVTPGVVTIFNVSPNSGWVIVQNESPYSLAVSIDGTGSTRTIPAQVMDKVPIPAQGFNGNIILSPSQILSNASNAPSFAVLLDAYGPHEEPIGNYPVALSRAVQVGGKVNTNVAATSAIVNDGNPVNTSIIEATPTGAASSTWTADNTGNLTVKSDNAGTLTTLLQLIAGASPGVKLAAAAVLTEVLGDLQADTNLLTPNVKLTGGFGTGNPKISPDLSAQAINFDVPDGTRIMQVNSGGLDLKTSGHGISATLMNFTTGSISRIAKQSASLASGHQTYTHNLGWVPDYTVITATVSGGGSATVGWDSPTSTTIGITTGAALHYDMLFIKF